MVHFCLDKRYHHTASILPIYNIPFERNPYFTGRETLLQQLHEQLKTKKQIALKQAITGIGGVGKTQTALEYIYRYRENYHDILWANGGSLEDLTDSYVILAGLLYLREKDFQDQGLIVSAVKRWLSTHERWLLILDNVEDFNLVKQFVPSARQGTVLITTQKQVTEPVAQSIEIDCMGEEEGALFLLRRANLLPHYVFSKQAKALSRELGGLPLALDQAGAYIREIGCSLSDYLDLYMKKRKELLDRRGEVLTDHEYSVYATFSLAFSKVEQKHRAAPELLRFFSFLIPDNIPEELVLNGGYQLGQVLQSISADRYEYGELINALRTFSLIHPNIQTKSFNIHRLVQAVMQETIKDEEKKQWKGRIVHAVYAILLQEFELAGLPFWERYVTLGFLSTKWPWWEHYLSSVRVSISFIREGYAICEHGRRLLQLAGLYLLQRFRYKEAEAAFQQIYAISKQQGLHPIEIMPSLHLLGRLYYEWSKYNEAERYLIPALELFELHGAPRDPEYPVLLNHIGQLYMKQDRYKEAEIFLKRALDAHEQYGDSMDPQVTAPLDSLGQIYMKQGKYQEAEALIRRALALHEQMASEDATLAVNLSSLAHILHLQEKDEEVEQLYQRALAIYEQKGDLGQLHVSTLLCHMAEFYRAQGNYSKAEQFCLQALKLCELDV